MMLGVLSGSRPFSSIPDPPETHLEVVQGRALQELREMEEVMLRLGQLASQSSVVSTLAQPSFDVGKSKISVPPHRTDLLTNDKPERSEKSERATPESAAAPLPFHPLVVEARQLANSTTS